MSNPNFADEMRSRTVAHLRYYAQNLIAKAADSGEFEAIIRHTSLRDKDQMTDMLAYLRSLGLTAHQDHVAICVSWSAPTSKKEKIA